MKKSNIKSKKFYQEAEEMADGWGGHLRAIDMLRDKFDRNEKIDLKEACYILWADKCVCSTVYLDFKKSMEDQEMGGDMLPWSAWYGMFENWNRLRKVA